METWFSLQIDQPFTLFGQSHITMLTLFVIVSVFILSTANLLKKSRATHSLIRWTLFCLLLFSEISYQTWAITKGIWGTGEHLPLHLCGIASLLGALALLTYQPKLIKITYFIGTVPAAIALITPDLLHDYEHFRFWKFFLHHMAISWTSLFLIVTTSVKISWKDLMETFLYLIVYSTFIGLINTIAGTNYLYLQGPPVTGTPLDWMGEGFFYYINLAVTAFFVFAVMVLVYKFADKMHNEK
ncbi:YwaF family protein [Halobacillus sp. H74]|uniref:YwaF family protein n=1 Tax=Halobacillus sp. H74 TaxID=3457436 RepID=UPI003FCE2EBC